ncbi:MAG: GNAT family N-acetyltransferase [Candidatus Handelsmanbacteria bacterium]|nr:GNAT family N-acetyltransferase [Candidatus Handelsmanbacteria bacterium]
MSASAKARMAVPQIRAREFPQIDAGQWNDAALRDRQARVQQSFQGAAIRHGAEGIRPLFLTAHLDQQVVGQLLLSQGFVHPDLLQWCEPLLRTRLCRNWWGVYRWIGGPLVAEEDAYPAVLRQMLHYLDLRARDEGILAICDATPGFHSPHLAAEEEAAIFADLGFTRREQATMVLDLGPDLDSLWRGLSRDARQKVQKAERLGIRVVEAHTEEGIRRYYSVRRENSRRNGVRCPHLKGILAAGPVYLAHDMGKVFLTEYEGRVLSGQMLVHFNGYVQLAGICLSDYAWEQGLPANDLMQWHLIRWGRESGKRSVDWSGYTPDPTTDKERGINTFKGKWGGRVIRYGVYDKVYGPRREAAMQWVKDLAKGKGRK